MSITKFEKLRIWAPENEIEPQALAQLKNTASLPWVFRHVAAMPDVHWGMGATVGSVIAMKDAVSPAAVGVDIGCGMAAVRMDLTASDLPDSLADLRHEIERSIPVGFNWHKEISNEVGANKIWRGFKDLHKTSEKLLLRAGLQLGTLGGGNHFIELCIDEDGAVWFMLHSGSRHIGKTLADHHIKIAKTLAHNEDLPDPDLSVFLAGTPEMAAYRNDLYWAQEYALHGHEVVHRQGPRLRGELPVRVARRRPADEQEQGEEDLHTRRPGGPDQRGRVPKGQGGPRRDPRRLQGYRQGHGLPGGSRRDPARATPGAVREGMSHE